MRTYFLYTVFILLFGSCNSQDKSKDTIMNSYKAKVQFYFYPSSGGDAIYEVDYNDGQITIKNNEVSNVIFRTTLNKEENAKINEFADRIKIAPNTTTEIILDSWRIELKIDGKVYYNKSGIKMKDLPPKIKNLLDYLLRDSTVKIDLYDFS
jgi:hypothetical protein